MSFPSKCEIDAIILDLSKIERILKTDSDEKTNFLSNFRAWTNQRTRTLSQLQRLKTELDDICRQAKIGKCVGAGLSVVGALASIIGFGLSLSNDESTKSTGKNITKCGIGAGAIGGAASIVSSAVECGVNRRILNEVKSTLEKDQQLTKNLIPYLDRSDHLNSLFQKVFDCDILSDTKEDIFTVINGIKTLYDEGSSTFEEISEAFSSSISQCTRSYKLEKIKKIFLRLSEKCQFILLEFCEKPKVREAILEIVLVIERSPIAFDVSKMCLRILRRVSSIDLLCCILLPTDLARLFEKSISQSAHVFEKFILFAMDIVFLIANAKDIANSESKYSGMVVKIESFLSRELHEARSLVKSILIEIESKTTLH